jgi:hypothetical protein
MTSIEQKTEGLSLPIVGMLILGILGAITVAACFVVIRSWPLPESVAPYFGGRIGFVWGGIVGAVTGLIIGYLVDDQHFQEPPTSSY